jgi:hypothetical protein
MERILIEEPLRLFRVVPGPAKKDKANQFKVELTNKNNNNNKTKATNHKKFMKRR